jgi:tripartite-type tricarboxylate transporter receptor subunit TctC
MKLPRRQFLHLAVGALALPALSRFAWAQAYPARPVRILVGSAAGGTADILARLVGQWLSERLGQQFVVENRTGAGTNIATEAAIKASPDGQTLLLLTPSSVTSAILHEKLDFIHAIAPVAGVTRQPQVMLVHPSMPAKTIPELIAYARANPGKINMASAGIGTLPHLAGELFKMMAVVDMIHVPYRGGGPAMIDLIGGRVQMVITTTVATTEHIRSGKVRALAVTSATRSAALPDVPTVGEFISGYETSGIFGVAAPRNTPADAVDTLNKAVNAALVEPGIKARLADLGGEALPVSPADFGKLIAAETEKWSKVVKFSGAKPG